MDAHVCKRGLLLGYSGLGVWRCLKNVDDSKTVHVFFFCLFLSRFTGLILILNPKKKNNEEVIYPFCCTCSDSYWSTGTEHHKFEGEGIHERRGCTGATASSYWIPYS